MNATDTERKLRPVADGTKRNAIIKAVASYQLESSDAWSELDRLSSRTEFEEVDAVPEGIFEQTAGDFEAVATVYVTLNDGNRSAMRDSYPARVEERYDPQAEQASVVSFTVDVSSFYR